MIDPAQLNALYQLIGWDCRNRRTEAETTEMLRVSRYCIAAYTAEGALVGFARVCGDPYVAQVLARLYPFWTATERHGKLYNLYDHGRSSMFTVPKEFAIFMTTFAPLFTKRVWQHVQVLLVGAILSPGQRTITAVLRVMGLAQAKFFQKYHRVLNRAVWSSLEGARLLLSCWCPSSPLLG